MGTKKIILIILVVVLIISLFYCYKINHTNIIPLQNASSDVTQNKVINSAVFKCSENKYIQAVFLKDEVKLTLNEGKRINLSQVVSASGARYANEDESFVFWNKGDTAFIEEGGKTTFKDCIIPKTENLKTPISPISVKCASLGGHLSEKKRGDGKKYNLCIFNNNLACEGFSLFVGNCPNVGVDVTGYATIDQKYCIWNGGDTTSSAGSICTLKDNTKCSTLDFYNGKCLLGKTKL